MSTYSCRASKATLRCKLDSRLNLGISLGKNDELVGGGVRRSRLLSGSEEHEACDGRILDSGILVEQ